MPRYSLILPTHNRAEVVGFAIRSVLAQTETDFELFVVGDGCTDRTAEVVRSFGDPRIQWLDLPKAPFYGYANRNVALRRAGGEYVAYIAHDDLLLPDHLAVLSGQLEREKADWGFSRPVWVSMDGVVLPYSFTLRHADERRSFIVQGNPIPMSCVMHRRRVVETAGWWPEDVPAAADWAYWKAILSTGAPPAACRVPTTLHFVADWRRARGIGVGQPEATQLLHLAAREAWWPQVLAHAIAPGELEQAAFSRWLEAGGSQAVAALRDGVDSVLDRLAWDHLCDLRDQAATRPLHRRILDRLLNG